MSDDSGENALDLPTVPPITDAMRNERILNHARLQAAESIEQFRFALKNIQPEMKSFMVLADRINSQPCNLHWELVKEARGTDLLVSTGVVAAKDVIDWAYADNGWMIGGYSLTAVFRRMTEFDQSELRSELPFAIPDPKLDRTGAELITAIGRQDLSRVRHILEKSPELLDQDVWTAPRRELSVSMTPVRMRPTQYAVLYSSERICEELLSRSTVGVDDRLLLKAAM